MARLIKCPRCQAQMDVTKVEGGATVRCGDCNSMIRVPSGSFPKVEQPVAQAAPAAKQGGGRSTALFKKMSNVRGPGMVSSVPRGSAGGGEPRRGNNTGLIIGGVVGGLVVIVVLAVLVANKKEDKPKEKKAPVASTNNDTYEEPTPQPKNEEKKPDPNKVKKTDTGAYKAPDKFVPGAEKHARSLSKAWPEVKVEETVLAIYDNMAKNGDIAGILKDDWKYLPCIILRFLSDDENLAKGSFKAMSELCIKRKISSGKPEDPFKNPILLDLVNAYEYRAGDYINWAEWYNKNSETVLADWRGDPTGTNLPRMDAKTANWDKLLADLKEGGLDDPTTPAGLATQKMKQMGREGITILIGKMDPEDLMTLRVICQVLNHLTNQNKPLPTAATKGQAKSEWETWLKNN